MHIKFKPEIVTKNPADLIPYVKNAKVHSNEQIDKIAGQIHAVGFTQPIVVDGSNVIIAGHGRREAAIKLGLKEVPVIVADHLNEYEVAAARLADNKVAESSWDPDLLKFELGTLKMHDFDLGLTGFDLGSIENILNPLTSHSEYPESAHQSMSEGEASYHDSDTRQMTLIMDPETFEQMMGKFAALLGVFGVETNLEVVQELLAFYDKHSVSTQS